MLPLGSTRLVPEMVTGAGGEKTTLGTVRFRADEGPGAGTRGEGGGGEARGAGGGELMFSRPSKNSPILVVLMVSSTGLGGAETLPAAQTASALQQRWDACRFAPCCVIVAVDVAVATAQNVLTS